MTNESIDPPLKVEIAARAEAKLEIRAEVPSDAMGRFVDAVTDLFRPWSEARGLKADLIRLQREEVAIKVARLVRERADIKNEKLIPPPLKVLIPLFEHASQEDVADDFIIEAWAKLLASACTPKSIPPRFISLISEMNSRQAKLFLDVMEKSGSKDRETRDLSLLQQHYIEGEMERLLAAGYPTAGEMIAELLPMMNNAGIALDDIVVSDTQGFHSVENAESPYGTEEEVSDLEVLKSLGLFEHVNIWRTPSHPVISTIHIRYYIATHLAEIFYNAIR
jgi:hypothetical protein